MAVSRIPKRQYISPKTTAKKPMKEEQGTVVWRLTTAASYFAADSDHWTTKVVVRSCFKNCYGIVSPSGSQLASTTAS